MVNDIQSLRELMSRVRKAQEIYSTFDQVKVCLLYTSPSPRD